MARDRLPGLMTAFPADLEIREKLGDVYFQLGYTVDAGRCWYFASDPNEVKAEAVEAFLHSWDFKVEEILRRLKVVDFFEGHDQNLTRDEIVKRVSELREKKKPVEPETRQASSLVNLACLVIALILLVPFGVGVSVIFQWFKSLFPNGPK